jgi:hypothetical protein
VGERPPPDSWIKLKGCKRISVGRGGAGRKENRACPGNGFFVLGDRNFYANSAFFFCEGRRTPIRRRSVPEGRYCAAPSGGWPENNRAGEMEIFRGAGRKGRRRKYDAHSNVSGGVESDACAAG